MVKRRRIRYRVHHVHLSRKRRNFNTVRMFTAVENGNAVKVQSLIKLGVRINARDNYKMNLLHVNAINGNYFITKLLIRAGCYVNSINCIGDTPLHEAIFYQNTGVVKNIIRNGARLNRTNVYGMSALHFAVQAKNEEIVQFLLNAGSKVNRRGINVDNQNKFGATALHTAIICKNPAIVHILLDHGASVHVKTEDGDTPLHWASMINSHGSQFDILRMLLKYGSDVNDLNARGQTPLHLLVQGGDTDSVQLLLDHKADVSKVDFEGSTVLHYVIYNSREEVLHLVIDRGVAIDQPCNIGLTPLHHASKQFKQKYISELISRGAKIDAKDIYGRTPFYFSVTESYLKHQVNRPNIVVERKQVMECLLAAGTDLNLKFYSTEQPKVILDIASQRRDFDACTVIIEHVAKVEARTKTPVFSERYMATIDRRIKRHYDRCCAELTIMGQTKIADTFISYLDVLVKPPSVVTRYMRNDKIVSVLDTDYYRTAFPIYKEHLGLKFNTAATVQSKMKIVSLILSKMMRFADPTHECFEIIFKHLSRKDIDFLIDAAIAEYIGFI